MHKRLIFSIAFMSLIYMSTVSVQAIQKDITVKYLIAALGTIQVRERLSVTAIYVGSEGMEEAMRGPLRSKGLTKFYIKDPSSSSIFDLMYCEISSSVFKTLININDDTKAFVFEGIKSQGVDRRGAFIVKSIRPARNIPTATTENSSARNSSPDKYRIIMVDKATSNRTVTADVELGKKYNIMGNSIIIENMNPKSNNVKIMQ